MNKQYQHELRKYLFVQLFDLAKYAEKVLVAEVQKEIVRQGLTATWDLYNSISANVNKLVDSYVVKMFSSVPYAMAVEKGSRPHMPPVNNIAKWIVAKNNTAGFYIEEKNIESVAWAIALEINRKGTASTRFFELGVRNARKKIDTFSRRMRF